MEQDLVFSYASKPRPVQTKRSKACDDSNKIAPINIMHDPRILRGSNFAPNNVSNFDTKQEKIKKRKSAGRKKKSNNATNHENIFETRRRLSNAFTSISLDTNLIEEPQTIIEYDSVCQTDEFLPRTITTTSSNLSRQSSGIDNSTQIEEPDKLFDFDNEVKPLVNVLVNKTLAQALQEVEEEQVMKMLHCEHNILKAAMYDAKHAERVLEEKAKKAACLKERLKREKTEQLTHNQTMREKLLAWQLARPLVSKAMDQTTHTMQKKGIFDDPMVRDISRWLAKDVYKGADNSIHLRSLSSKLLDDLLFHGLRR